MLHLSKEGDAIILIHSATAMAPGQWERGWDTQTPPDYLLPLGQFNFSYRVPLVSQDEKLLLGRPASSWLRLFSFYFSRSCQFLGRFDLQGPFQVWSIPFVTTLQCFVLSVGEVANGPRCGEKLLSLHLTNARKHGVFSWWEFKILTGPTSRTAPFPGELNLVWDPAAKETDGVLFTFQRISFVPGGSYPSFQTRSSYSCLWFWIVRHLFDFLYQEVTANGRRNYAPYQSRFYLSSSSFIVIKILSNIFTLAKLRGRQCWVDG